MKLDTILEYFHTATRGAGSATMATHAPIGPKDVQGDGEQTLWKDDKPSKKKGKSKKGCKCHKGNDCRCLPDRPTVDRETLESPDPAFRGVQY